MVGSGVTILYCVFCFRVEIWSDWVWLLKHLLRRGPDWTSVALNILGYAYTTWTLGFINYQQSNLSCFNLLNILFLGINQYNHSKSSSARKCEVKRFVRQTRGRIRPFWEEKVNKFKLYNSLLLEALCSGSQGSGEGSVYSEESILVVDSSFKKKVWGNTYACFKSVWSR